MNKVYFSKNIEKIIEKIDFSKLGDKVAIKVHFGEKGCVTYMNPEIVSKVYQKIESLGKKPTLVECNVLYKGSRTNATDHIETAKEHGFGNMRIDILDGENGEKFIELNGCKIGKGVERYDSLVVISHFKGHSATGFGGALKNVGMGLGSRAGKLDMHSKIRPSVSDKCVGCGICVEHCNANAISVEGGKAVINKEKCEGCAMCIAICPNEAVEIPWEGRTAADLQKRITEYAKGVLNRFPNSIFINILEKITEECDCWSTVQKPVMDDVGIVYAENIVAADKASLDLANKFSEGKFENINKTDKENQIKVAKDLGLGESEYELINLDN